jgi:hypothetical protein
VRPRHDLIWADDHERAVRHPGGLEVRRQTRVRPRPWARSPTAAEW